MGAFLHRGWECEIVLLPWKMGATVPQKQSTRSPSDPAVPLLGWYPKEPKVSAGKYVCTPVFIAALSTTKMEASQVSTNRWMETQNVGRHPCQVARLVGASSRTPRGRGFDSQSGCIPRLWVQSLVRAHMVDNQLVFFFHIDISLFLSPFLSLSKKKNQ